MTGKIVKGAGILLLTGTVLLGLAFIAAAFYIDHLFSNADWKKTAYPAIVQARAQSQIKLDDLIALYPQEAGYSNACYRAGLSHYVEDQWDRIGRETGCDSNEAFCTNIDIQGNGLFQFVAGWVGKDLAHVLTPPLLALEKMIDPEMGHAIVSYANVWPAAGKVYQDMRLVSLALLPRDETAAFSAGYDPDMAVRKHGPRLPLDQELARVNELRGYMDHCDTFKPLPWATVGAEMPTGRLTPYLTVSAIKIGLYSLYMSDFIGSRVAPEKRGYIGCLNTLNQFRLAPVFRACQGDVKCIESAPADTPQDLTARLEDLKAHQCMSAYAYTMTQ